MTKTITYLATNQKNGKWYVGSTVQLLEHRIAQHKDHKGNDPFHNSLKKNPDLFSWEVLSEVEADTPDRSHEQEILDTWFGTQYCYNLSSRAVGICPEIASENGKNTCEKIWSDPEFRERQRVWVSESAKRQWQDPEFRDMMGSWTAKRWEEDKEFRDMMSERIAESNRRRAEDPEYTGGNIRPVILTHVATGVTEVFSSIAAACRAHPELDGSKVSAVCRKNRKSHKGYTARYLED